MFLDLQAREAEGAAYEKRIADLQHKAQVNEEQLSAEIKVNFDIATLIKIK